MPEIVRVAPLGSMDKDSALTLVRNGNYSDAHDIRHQDLGGNQGVQVVNFEGNSLAATISAMTNSTKKFRLYLDITKSFSPAPGPNPLTGTITVIDSNAGTQQAVIVVSEANITDFIGVAVTGLQAQMTAAFDNGGLLVAPFTFSNTNITGTYTGYFDVEANDLDDTTFEIFHEGDLISRIVQIQDSFGISTTAPVKITGSEQIGKDLFISSCTTEQHNAKYIWELGVVTYNENTDAYTYTRLLRTNRLGFRPDYQVQIKGEVNGNRVSLYMTDRNSLPRTIYVNKPYATDVCLFPDGDYSYQTIDEETYLFLRPPAAILDLVSVEPGGSVTAGNKRYTGRFLTESLVATEVIDVTSPINVYIGDTLIPSRIKGGDPGEETDKKVVLELSGIPVNVYKYFELIAIEYSNESVSTKVVQRYTVPDSTDSIIVEHTELGQDNRELSFPEILALNARFDVVGSLEIVNNRLVTANLHEEQDIDLSDWAQTIEHSLEKTIVYVALTNDAEVKGVGSIGDLNYALPQYQFGEYQDPNNVFNKVGYMYNDTYRFGIQVRWKKTGRWSKVFHVDDIRFDLSATGLNGSTRRVANNLDTNFSEGTSEELNIYHVKFSNVDLSATVDGQSVYDLIDAYRFVRAERIPEVLATGLFFPSLKESGGTDWLPYYDDGGTLDYATPVFSRTHDSRFLFFLSPDLFYGKKYEFQTGDVLKIMGNIREANKDYKSVNNSSANASHFVDCSGYFTDQTGTPVDYTEFSISAASPMNYSKSVTVSSGNIMTSTYDDYTVNCQHVFQVPTAVFGNVGDAAMIADDITALFYGQIFRDLGAELKYPVNKETTQYYTIGHIRELTGSDKGVLEDEIYGGDVFTQKSFMRVRIKVYENPAPGGGSGIAFYSQNVVNTQMRTIRPQSDEPAGEPYVFPQLIDRFGQLGTATPSHPQGTVGRGLANWLEQWIGKAEQLWYNNAYDIKNSLIAISAFDPNATYTGDRDASMAWSSVKTAGSLKDDYRIFRPLDVADLDLTKGEIEHIMEINGNLYSWQRDSFQRQYFNDPTTVGAEGGTDVVIGTGGILGLRGQELSSIGSDKKWAIFKGKNTSGKDVAYWYNDINRKIMRFAADGVGVISDPSSVRPGISSWLRTYANFLTEEEEPITGRGIHGVWNHRYNEAIFTFKGFTNALTEIPEVGGGVSITINSIYTNANAPATHHSGLPSIFRAKSSFTYNNLGTQEPGVGSQTTTYWDELGPEDYPQYYACFTIAFDESKGGFVSFHEYFPNIYLPYFDNFGSPDPLTENELWMHDDGAITEYYGTGYAATITPVLNIDPNLEKQFSALQVNSDVVPNRIDFTTQQHTSFLTETDFESREDFFYSTIKNNAVAGVVTGDSSRLFGKYLKIKMTFETAVQQRLLNFIVKYRPKHRLYNR